MCGFVCGPPPKPAARRLGKFSDQPEGSFKVSIIGGTGAYKDATGEATVVEGTPMCDKKGATVTLDLLLQH